MASLVAVFLRADGRSFGGGDPGEPLRLPPSKTMAMEINARRKLEKLSTKAILLNPNSATMYLWCSACGADNPSAGLAVASRASCVVVGLTMQWRRRLCRGSISASATILSETFSLSGQTTVVRMYIVRNQAEVTRDVVHAAQPSAQGATRQGAQGDGVD